MPGRRGDIFVANHVTKNHQPLKNQQKLVNPARALDIRLTSESRRIRRFFIIARTPSLEHSPVEDNTGKKRYEGGGKPNMP